MTHVCSLVNVTMHRLFEKFYWTLVPDLDDLDAVHALYRFGWDEPYSRVRIMLFHSLCLMLNFAKFPRLDPYARLANKEPFSYHFVPLPTLTECKNANIVRYTTGPEVFSEEVPSEEFAQCAWAFSPVPCLAYHRQKSTLQSMLQDAPRSTLVLLRDFRCSGHTYIHSMSSVRHITPFAFTSHTRSLQAI